jgi:hypothetical protein
MPFKSSAGRLGVASDFKASRRLISEHARWFNLRNYDRLQSASHEVWFTQSALRIDLHRMRSLFAGPDGETKRMHLGTHGALVGMLRASGIVEGTTLKQALELEEFMYPESFSVLHLTRSDGVHVRPLNLEDIARIHNGLSHVGPFSSISDTRLPYRGIRAQHSTANDESQILSDPIEKHVHRSLTGSYAYIKVDLSCPRELLVKQFAELIDRQRKPLGPLLAPAQQTTSPTVKAWVKSKVLPYIDLRDWRNELQDTELRNLIKDADIAAALEIDSKTLSETTKVHAQTLSDPTTWGFIHLVEAAISHRRGPLTLQRQTKKTQRTTPKTKN